MIPVFQKRARLGSFGLHVVAIQVSVRGVGAPTDLLRTVLVDTVVFSEILVTVGVVDWHDDQYCTIKERSLRLCDQHVAQQRQGSILAVHFACVDGVLYVDYWAVRLVNGHRIKNTILGDDHCKKFAALTGPSKRLRPDLP